MEIAEGRQAFERQTWYRIVNVGYTVIISHPLSRNVPSEEVVSDPRGPVKNLLLAFSWVSHWSVEVPTQRYTSLIRDCRGDLVERSLLK